MKLVYTLIVLLASPILLSADIISIDNGNSSGNSYRSSWAYFEESVVLQPVAPCDIDSIFIYYSGDQPAIDTLMVVGFPTSGNLWPTQYVWNINKLIEPIVYEYDGNPGWKKIDISSYNLRSEGLDKIVIQHRMKPQGPWFTYDSDGRNNTYASWITDPFTPNPNFYNIIGTIFYYPAGDFMIRLSVNYDYPIINDKVIKPAPDFVDVSSEVGLSGRGMSAVVDWNNDNWDDIVNSGSFFENNNGQYTNINDLLSITRGNTTWGDINNDGLKDIFVAKNWENNKVYLNNGNNDYTDITTQSTIVNDYPTMTPIWLDYNNDGLLDLFIANNRTTQNGQEVYFPDQLWKNNGDLTFTNVRDESNISSGEPPQNFDCYGAAANDYNNDNYTDIFVANYRLAPDNQYKNMGDGTFEDVAHQTGLEGNPTASPDYFGHGMGCNWGDFNNDGYIDLCVGNLAHTDSRGMYSNPSLIFKNNGPPNYDFDEVHEKMGLKFYEGNAGTIWADLNLDGYLDLWHGLYSGGVNHLYINQGPPDFFLKEVTWVTGTVVTDPWTASSIDYDNDGDIDLLIYGKLYRNDMKREGKWLELRLSGSPENNVNSDAYGSRIFVYSGDEMFYRQHSGSAAGSRCSQNSDIIHFGLGNVEKIDSLVVIYSNGEKNKITDIDINGIYNLPYMSNPNLLLSPTPSLNIPEIFTKNIGSEINLNWNSVAGADNYLLQVSDTKDFTNLIISEKIDTTSRSTTLNLNKTFYWRVKSYSGNDSSKFSSIWEFTTGLESPSKIEIENPGDNTQNVSIRPLIKWSEPEYKCQYCYNTYYELQISDSIEFNNLSYHYKNLIKPILENPEPLEAQSIYYIRARALNDSVPGQWSDIIKFETMALPPTPSLTNPPNGEQEVSQKPRFEWQEIQEANSYQLQTSEQSDFTNIFFEQENIKSNAFRSLSTKFTEGTTYFWRIRAKNEGGYGSWSETWSFTVKGVKPNVNENYKSLNIQILPNPVKSILTISVNSQRIKNSIVNIKIFNPKGIIILNKSIFLEEDFSNINLDLSGIPNGVYFCQINKGLYTKTYKIIVIH